MVDRSVEKVKAIARTIEESGRLMKLLGDRSDQIGAILNVINDIADQTNLLALNATIEAARTGEAGRGFASVSRETSGSSEQISIASQNLPDLSVNLEQAVGGFRA